MDSSSNQRVETTFMKRDPSIGYRDRTVTEDRHGIEGLLSETGSEKDGTASTVSATTQGHSNISLIASSVTPSASASTPPLSSKANPDSSNAKVRIIFDVMV